MNEENNLAISVIMPSYNIAKFVSNALDSVLQQDFDSYEIIIIDDGSNDNLKDIVDEYRIKYNNIYYYKFKNQGVSQARNEGIKRANGEYIYFMDPDDELYGKDVFRKVYTKALEQSYDVVSFGFRFIREDGTFSDTASSTYSLSSNASVIKEFLPLFVGTTQQMLEDWSKKKNRNAEFASVWRCILKRSIMADNSILFQKDVSVIEDRLFLIHYFMYADKICMIPNIFYLYYVRSTGALHTNCNTKEKIYKNKVKSLQKREELRSLYLEKRGVDIFSTYISTPLLNVLELIVVYSDSPLREGFSKVGAFCKLLVVRESLSLIKIKDLSFKMKLLIILLRLRCHNIILTIVVLFKKASIRVY